MGIFLRNVLGIAVGALLITGSIALYGAVSADDDKSEPHQHVAALGAMDFRGVPNNELRIFADCGSQSLHANTCTLQWRHAPSGLVLESTVQLTEVDAKRTAVLLMRAICGPKDCNHKLDED